MPPYLRRALIVFFSPGGSTEHVAQVMKSKIRSLQVPVTMLNLGRDPDIPLIITQLVDAKDHICLYIGSPVYASHAVPPIMEFISSLPMSSNGCSVPFVTWGGVTSGIALHSMGKALEEKGYSVVGAAKVLAKHSLMWASDTPLGENHPDAGDDQMIEEFLEKVHRKLLIAKPKGLPLSLLAYQREEIHAEAEQMSFASAKGRFPPRQIDEKRCTGCGLCVDLCPVKAITLSPYPEFAPSCVYCLNCVRLCPEEAIAVDLVPVLARIRAKAKLLNERPFIKIFV